MCPVSKQKLFPRIPVPPAVYPNVVVEEEMEEEDTAQEETEDQQTSGRGDSLVKSHTDRTDSMFLLY